MKLKPLIGAGLLAVGTWTALLGSAVHLAEAQTDAVPPVLLDFTITPTTFDATEADVTLNWCLTARDGAAIQRHDPDVLELRVHDGDQEQRRAVQGEGAVGAKP